MHLYTNKELCEISYKIFEYDGTFKDYLSQEQLKSLIKTLCLKYNVIPYHNWTHAFSVFQVFIFFLLKIYIYINMYYS